MRIIIILLITFVSLNVNAQKLTVESFSLAQTDLSAQTYPRKDNNGVNCALVKVGFGQQGCQFEGGIIGPVQNKTGEYWVYMPKGNRCLQVKHPNYSPLMVTFSDYGIDRLESNRTYRLTIIPSGNVTSNQKQTLNISFTPVNASVLIDNEIVETSNGRVSVSLPVGKHDYIITAKGYESEDGTINIKASAPSNINVQLTKKSSPAIVNNPTPTPTPLPVAPSPNTNTQNLTFTVNGVTFEMVKVDGGTFTMGATSEQGSDAYDWEKPTHQVTLSSYYIGKYEVTQALWQAVTGRNPSDFKGDNLPVEEVSWDDCQSFISKLNSMTGKTFRLPTEAEWEFACRGGGKSRGYKYSGSNNLNDVAWYDGNSGNNTHPVGTKSPNELGLYDMSGNVWEWCSDWYDSYSSSSQTNPTGASSGSYRVLRGGGWLNFARYCRSSNRYYDAPDYRCSNLGLRLVLSE